MIAVDTSFLVDHLDGERAAAEFLDAGEPMNLGDVLIAGCCRHTGAVLVTRDGDVDRIEGLAATGY